MLDVEIGRHEAQGVEELVDAVLEIAPPRGRTEGRGHEGGGQHLVEPADGLARALGQGHEIAARVGVDRGQRDGLPEGDERARPVAHREVHHLGHFGREEALAPLDPLAGQGLVLEHEVVGDPDRHDHGIGAPGLQDRLQQPRLQRLELAVVAAPALGVEEQVVPMDQLGHVRPQRREVRGVAGVPANRDGAGDVAVQQPHGAVEQVDAGGDDGGTDVMVVEHHELDEVVHVALVVRGVDDPVRAGGVLRPSDVLRVPLYLPQDRVQRVLQGAIHLVALRRPELLEVGGNPLLRLVGLSRVLPRRYRATSSRDSTAWVISSTLETIPSAPAGRRPGNRAVGWGATPGVGPGGRGSAERRRRQPSPAPGVAPPRGLRR